MRRLDLELCVYWGSSFSAGVKDEYSFPRTLLLLFLFILRPLNDDDGTHGSSKLARLNTHTHIRPTTTELRFIK